MNMRFISTRVHGVLDYLIGFLLIVWPLTWGNVPEAAVWLPIVMGVFLICYSVITNYEWGLFRGINMPTHLGLDIVVGLILAASPWVFGFDEFIYLPHLIVGVVAVMAGLTTRTVPSHGPTYHPPARPQA